MAQLIRLQKFKVINKIAGSEIVLFNNLDLTVDEKEWVNIVIPHGGGKTTLYKILLSQVKPTSGKVIYNNQDKKDDYDRDKFIQENITSVAETPVVTDNFTVRDWTRFQIELLRPKKYKNRLKEFYIFLDNIGINPEKYVTQLSLLEVRKLEISLTILIDTILIICDDIEVGLKKDEIENLADFLKIINKNKAIITLSSDQVFSRFAKKVIRI